MTRENTTQQDYEETVPRINEFQRFRKVFFSRKVVVFGMLVILLLLGVDILPLT